MKSKKTKLHHTLTALAGVLKVPVANIREAKKAGAAGFAANGNVDPLKLLGWCLTKGKKFEPTQSLEAAKTRLTNVRAQQIEQEARLGNGQIVSLQWADAKVAEAFATAGGWFGSRLENLGTVLGMQLAPNNHEGQQEIMRLLEDDLKLLRTSMLATESEIRRAFRDGEVDSEANILRDLDAHMKEIADKLSPAARAEIVALIAK